jgi:hypothetical protein
VVLLLAPTMHVLRWCQVVGLSLIRNPTILSVDFSTLVGMVGPVRTERVATITYLVIVGYAVELGTPYCLP